MTVGRTQAAVMSTRMMVEHQIPCTCQQDDEADGDDDNDSCDAGRCQSRGQEHFGTELTNCG